MFFILNEGGEHMTRPVGIETARLRLRPFTLDDAERLYECLNEANYLQFVPFQPLNQVEEARRLIKQQFLSKTTAPKALAIVRKDTQDFIGLVALVDYNRRAREGQVGYVIHPEYTNQGYMTEALRAFIDYSFRYFNLERLYGKTHPLNLASQKVMIHVGMDYVDAEKDRYGNLKRLVFVRAKY